MGGCGTKNDVTSSSRRSVTQSPIQTNSLSSFLNSSNYLRTYSIIADLSIPVSEKVNHLKEVHQIYLKKHSGEVTSVAVSPDRSFTVTTCNDGSVRFWNIAKRKQFNEIIHKKPVNQAVVTYDQSYLVTLSEYKEISIWSLETFQLKNSFKDFKYFIGSIQIANIPNEVYLGGGYLPQQNTCPIRVLNIETGEEIRKYEGHRAAANQIVFSKDFSSFVSCSGGQFMTGIDNSVRFWSVKKEEPKASYSEFQNFVNSVCISNSMQFIMAGSKDCTIHLLTYNLEKVHIFRGHTSSVSSLVLIENEEMLVSGSFDSTIKVWDLKNKWMDSEYRTSTVFSLASLDSYIIAGCNSTVKVFDRKNSKEMSMPGHYGEIEFMKVNPNSEYLLTGSKGKMQSDKYLQIWNLYTGEQEKVISQISNFNDIKLNSDGTGVLFIDGETVKGYSVRGQKKWIERSNKLEFLLLARRGFRIR